MVRRSSDETLGKAAIDWILDSEILAPPRAQLSFQFYSYPQVDRLLSIHSAVGGSRPGRRYRLEILNKSAIVLACAFWEAFVEDLTADALLHLAKHADNAQVLPKELRKSILKDLQAKKHELAVWDIADNKWRELLRERARKIVEVGDRTLSSPSCEKVDDFFCRQAGLIRVSDSWRWPGTSPDKARQKLDEFVQLRNVIAHRGGPRDATVTKRDAERGLALIDRLADLCVNAADVQLSGATKVRLIGRTSVRDYEPDDT
jgi:hypothetical protein